MFFKFQPNYKTYSKEIKIRPYWVKQKQGVKLFVLKRIQISNLLNENLEFFQK